MGLTEEQLKSITPNFEFALEQTDEEASGNVYAMMLLSLVLFYAIYFCAYQVSSSITTEKTSKIIETLVTSTSPKTIVLGKTLGIGIVGLLQMILLVGTALISAKTFLEPGILDSIIDVSKITPYLGIITIIYFIFAVMLVICNITKMDSDRLFGSAHFLYLHFYSKPSMSHISPASAVVLNYFSSIIFPFLPVFYANAASSKSIVNGPSFIKDTFISAPKIPVSTTGTCSFAFSIIYSYNSSAF